ncbi:MAG: 50S ribosomal protein L28 [bacterium]|nr:50S ribosomal protein L28 [bacterium]
MRTSAHPKNNRRGAKRRALAKLGIVEKRPQSGHNVSHAQNKTKRLFRPNLQKTKILVDGKLVRVKLDAKTIRNLTKLQKDRPEPTKPKKRPAAKPAKKAAAKKSANAKK